MSWKDFIIGKKQRPSDLDASDANQIKADSPIFFTNPFSQTTVIGACIRGASHVKSETNCQDAYRIAQGASSAVSWLSVAVADGHGADKHDLSEFGSAILCREACQLLEEIALRDADEEDFKLKTWIEDSLPTELRKRWRLATGRDYKSKRDSQGLDGGVRQEYEPSRYGTTLLSVFLHDDILHVFRVGDGDIALKFRDGHIEEAFSDHEELSGSETYSFSQDDVQDHFEYRSVPLQDGLQAVYLSTDGLSNSYQDISAYHKFLDALHGQVLEFGALPVAEILPDAMKNATNTASGDDITLVAVLLRENLKNVSAFNEVDVDSSDGVDELDSEETEVSHDDERVGGDDTQSEHSEENPSDGPVAEDEMLSANDDTDLVSADDIPSTDDPDDPDGTKKPTTK
jgi:serine/threonine protein phosphatase PrpC